MMYISLFNN